MRLASIIAMSVGAATGLGDVTTVPGASVFMRSLDAPPEALMIGGGLLMLASLLRLRLPKTAK